MDFAYPSPEHAECPFPLYDQARKACPVPKIPDQNAYFITRYEDVLFVARNPELFSSVGRSIGAQPSEARQTGGGVSCRSLLESDPPEHVHHRRICVRHLNPKKFRESQPQVLQHVTSLIDGFAGRGTCEFVSEFADPLPGLVLADIMGFPMDFVDQLVCWGQIEIQGIMFYEGERKLLQYDTYENFKTFVEGALRQRFETPTEDALGHLVQDQIARDGEFDLEYLKSQAIVLVAGGLITTAHLISNTMLMLLKHPEQMKAIVDKPELVPKALDESLRLESPVQWVPRRVTQDIELSGQKLPEGSHVLIGMGSANRDPEKFPEPDKFNIFRENASQHVAFGNGAHFCIGAPLARLEAITAFEQLFKRLKNIRATADNDFRHIDSPVFRGVKRLNLAFDVA